MPSRRRPRQDPLAGLPTELQRVLDDAAAPAHPSELQGMHAATAAFTSTLSERAVPVNAVSWNLAKLVATPLAAALAVTGLTGGVALAAASGALPDPVQQLASNLGAPAPDREQAQRSATATANLTKAGRGRCTAVTMGNKGERGKALQAPPLAATAAGDCPERAKPGSNRSETATAVLEGKPAKPAKPAKPSKPVKPVQPETTEPGGKPDGVGRPEQTGPVRTPGRPAEKPSKG